MAKMLLMETQRTKLCNSCIKHLFKLIGFLLRKRSNIWPLLAKLTNFRCSVSSMYEYLLVRIPYSLGHVS